MGKSIFDVITEYAVNEGLICVTRQLARLRKGREFDKGCQNQQLTQSF